MSLPSWIACRTAPNPGPYTLEGTNTWIITDPAGEHCAIVDPGPDDATHIAALADAVPQGAEVTVIVTHWHADHTDGVAPLLRLLPRASVTAVDEGWCARRNPLRHNQILKVGNILLTCWHTPGHSADSLSVLVQGPLAQGLISGDTLLGRGTTVIQPPDGDLADYLNSLDLLREKVSDRTQLWPGHGPVKADAAAVIAEYTEHRAMRLEQIWEAYSDGLTTPAEIRAAVYTDTPEELATAAEDSIAAQLRYLTARRASEPDS